MEGDEPADSMASDDSLPSNDDFNFVSSAKTPDLDDDDFRSAAPQSLVFIDDDNPDTLRRRVRCASAASSECLQPRWRSRRPTTTTMNSQRCAHAMTQLSTLAMGCRLPWPLISTMPLACPLYASLTRGMAFAAARARAVCRPGHLEHDRHDFG